MKRLTQLFSAILLATVLTAAGGLYWLFGTTGGARWLMGAVSRHAGVYMSARQVEGRLFDHLRLEEVRITARDRVAELALLDLRWQPLLLLSGRVSVRELILGGLTIRDNTPPSGSPPDLSWPTLSGVPAWFDGSVDRLRMERFTYQRRDEPPVAVSSFSSSIAWQDMLLSLRDLSLTMKSGRLTGLAEAGFRTPTLRLDLSLALAQPVAGMDGFAIRTGLMPGLRPEQLAGVIALTGSSGSRKLFELAGEAGLARNTINLKGVRLTRPGRKGTVGAEGAILLTAGTPRANLKLTVAGLDLSPETGMKTDISGNAGFEGNLEGYRGSFSLSNRGSEWRAARLGGDYRGDAAGMTLEIRNGSLLEGTLQGDLAVGWRDGMSLSGALAGRHLNPARIAPGWTGTINIDLQTTVSKQGAGPLAGNVSASLRDSILHDRALHGELQADFAGARVRIGRLMLQGNGFDIQAAGKLDQRLDFDVRVGDLTLLVPGTSGRVRAEGWVRWQKRLLGGYLSASGRDLGADGVTIGSANLTARLREHPEGSVTVNAALGKLGYRHFSADSATLDLSGTLARHTVAADLQTAGANLRLGLTGALRERTWQGEVVRLSGRDSSGPWHLDAPARFALGSGSISLSPLVIIGTPPERLEIAGDITRSPLRGSIRAEWSGLNLARANFWLSGMQVTGSSSGSFSCRMPGGDRLALSVAANLQGTVAVDDRRVTVRKSSLSIDWGEQGLKGEMAILLADGGTLRGNLSSRAPAGLRLPAEGDIALEWAGFDLLLLHHVLPEGVDLTGAITGKLTGKLLPDSRLDLRGHARVAGGKVRWQRPEGELNATLRTVEADFTWQGESLNGNTRLALEGYGEARGSFRLPIPARLPVTFERKGPVQATLNGKFREMGLLTALFPGLVQESHGELGVDLQAGGSWEAPRFTGSLNLAKAGAYLPAAGIQLKDVQFTARLEQDLIRVESFRALSGPGHIGGAAVIQLDGWRVAGYRGTIDGDRFQAVYLPELQAMASPKLSFEGTPKRLAVNGELKLPELLVHGSQTRPQITPSKDVIVVDAPRPPEPGSLLELDVRVRILLGDRVLVKAEGIDAQLGGGIELTFARLDDITSSGKINVVKGRYKTYGVDLNIVRGLLFYAGGPINRPTLDFLALRTVGEVRAGVTVGGTPQTPVVKLYSEPAMPDIDILAYVVLGHPLGASREQAGLMAQAAGLLLSAGDSVVLQDQIKNRLGLSTLEIESESATAGHMGYKPVTVTPPGTSPAAASAGGISQSLLTVGKYLTPKLYVSYGRSLFTGSNLLRVRYNIIKGLGIETEMGTESGADIYYKIELK